MKNGPYTLIVPPDGYPGKRYRSRYAYEHHVVWWRHTGETLESWEVIHHEDHDRKNNSFTNLVKLTKEEHQALHGSERLSETVSCRCANCLCEFTTQARAHHSKAKRGQEKFFCGRSCQVKHQWKMGNHDNLRKNDIWRSGAGIQASAVNR